MSAAHKPYIPVPVSRQKSQGSQRRPQSPVNQATPTAKSAARVPLSPTEKQVASRQLRSLYLLERIVAVITFCLLGSTLGMYAWTVYIPKVWDKEFGKLETLQRHERHLLATNETLKHQLAQQAEKPETGLTHPQPFQTIFLQRQSAPNLKPSPASQPQSTVISRPRSAY
ncbi:hypothetical protein MiAbW_01935 [Microcystis aeruginosa NIES-4325]|uniref:Cell division protein FtsL n=1 Tax=Microcystis aeruginosa NIES-4325 TaxID=2569534 RepID=A0A5J4F7V4_MICAE|nr:hypothetical protein [Microcystis aeruginosa]GEA27372.1 hypothetical protein MiAbW_01935 [Microcystis aeruginosa NIES-4325]